MHSAYFTFWGILSGLVLASFFVFQYLQKRRADRDHQQILELVETLHTRNKQQAESFEKERLTWQTTLEKILLVATPPLPPPPSPLPDLVVQYLTDQNRFLVQTLYGMAHSAQEKMAAFADHRVQHQVAAQYLRGVGPRAPQGGPGYSVPPGAAENIAREVDEDAYNLPRHPPGDGFRTEPVEDAPTDTIRMDPQAFSGNPNLTGAARELSQKLNEELAGILTAEDRATLREEIMKREMAALQSDQ